MADALPWITETGEFTYVRVGTQHATLHRAEVDGRVVGGITELRDSTFEWYTRRPFPDAGGEARSLEDAKAALEAALRRNITP